jgi:hypothetical protein
VRQFLERPDVIRELLLPHTITRSRAWRKD